MNALDRTADQAQQAVIFDMGSVLIGWDCRRIYAPYFVASQDLEAFLRGPFRDIYDAVHDGDGSIHDCLLPVREHYPHLTQLIDIYEHEWASFVTGPMHDSIAVVQELHLHEIPLYGLTNWPRQVWPPQRLLPKAAASFAFLELFEDIWVSGEHRLRKPDPRSYASALERFGIEAGTAVFVDDLAENVEAAARLGMHALRFSSARQLRNDLVEARLLPLEEAPGETSSVTA